MTDFFSHRLTYRYRLLISGILLLSLLSCSDEKTQAEIDQTIQQKLDERVEKYARAIRARCREDILAQASLQVDTIILLRSRQEMDSAARPERFPRPQRPPQLPLPDTLEVAPFLDSMGENWR